MGMAAMTIIEYAAEVRFEATLSTSANATAAPALCGPSVVVHALAKANASVVGQACMAKIAIPASAYGNKTVIAEYTVRSYEANPVSGGSSRRPLSKRSRPSAPSTLASPRATTPPCPSTTWFLTSAMHARSRMRRQALT
ncbi:Aste57867_10665 [Aphanomyces stellatus]|uniref:Aste57867_10665 protein n=1 Tax=Aphanomyces stellatus TaxID=120398 RepID=A0A485KRN4_9STRA|nr:hypothetical protein As57867_010625 [Aphanomyces stellatus]VFT87537.1 Aste57867_10665 [Aphanomyces stellatus]